MDDLFAPALEGLALKRDVVTQDEEMALIAAIEALELAPFRFQGWTGKRLTRSFGWSYDFDDYSFAQTDPLPDWIAPLRDQAAALSGQPPERFAHALITRYDPGAGIGWHRDRPVFDQVVGFSFGAPATLRLRQRVGASFRRTAIPLDPRSAYLLSGEAREAWEHSIAPVTERRYSITLRTLLAS